MRFDIANCYRFISNLFPRICHWHMQPSSQLRPVECCVVAVADSCHLTSWFAIHLNITRITIFTDRPGYSWFVISYISVVAHCQAVTQDLGLRYFLNPNRQCILSYHITSVCYICFIVFCVALKWCISYLIKKALK